MLKRNFLLVAILSLFVYVSAFSLDTPTLVAPANGTTNVDITQDINPSWNAVEGADGYIFELWWGDGEFLIDFFEVDASGEATETLNVPAGTLPIYGQLFSWSVVAFTEDGEDEYSWSEPSDFWTFETARPAIPNLVAPANGTMNVSLVDTPILEWEAVPYVDGYRVLVFNNEVEIMSAFILDDDMSETYTADFENGALPFYEEDYTWVVVAIQFDQSNSPLWEGWTFETEEMPSAMLIAPEDMETGVSITPTFEFERVPFAEYYYIDIYQIDEMGDYIWVDLIEIDDEANFFGPWDENVVVTLDEEYSLDYYNRYYWEVTAYGAEEFTGAMAYSFSETFMFRTELPPPPALLSPMEGEVDVDPAGPFTWTEVAGTEFYTLRIYYVSPNEMLEDLLVYENTVDASTLEPGDITYTLPADSELKWERDFYYTVEITIEDESVESEGQNFTTADIPTTTYLTPFVDEVVGRTPSAFWFRVRNADDYLAILYDEEMNPTLSMAFPDDFYEGFEFAGLMITDEFAFEPYTTFYWEVVPRQYPYFEETEGELIASAVGNEIRRNYTDNTGGPMEINPTDKETCFGEDVTIGTTVIDPKTGEEVDLTAYGLDGDFTFQWFPAANLDDATASNPTFINPKVTTNFTVVATNPETGEQLNGFNTVTVTPLPNPQMPLFVRVAQNTPVSLNDYITGVNGGVAPFQYRWVDNSGVELEDPDNVISPIGINRYFVSLTDAAGCQSVEKRLIVYVSPAKEFANDDIVTGLNGAGVMVTFPNPVVSDVQVVAEFESAGNISASIMNLTGQTVFTQSFGSNQSIETNLNLSNLPSGMYFLELTNGTEKIIKKIIKN